jgi:hypothetical protein
MKKMKAVSVFLLTLFRELADENAYQRYLIRHGRAPSRLEWQRFIDGHWQRKFVRPKCC